MSHRKPLPRGHAPVPRNDRAALLDLLKRWLHQARDSYTSPEVLALLKETRRAIGGRR